MGMGFSSARLFLALVSQGEVLAFCRRPFSRDFSSGSPSHGLQVCPKCSSKGFPRVHSPSGHSLLCWGLQWGGVSVPQGPTQAARESLEPLVPLFPPCRAVSQPQAPLGCTIPSLPSLGFALPSSGSFCTNLPCPLPHICSRTSCESREQLGESPGNSHSQDVTAVPSGTLSQWVQTHPSRRFHHIMAVGSMSHLPHSMTVLALAVPWQL